MQNVLHTISSYDNIPRKKAKFLNFMKNSFRNFKFNELEEAWDLLEVALKENRPQQSSNGAPKQPQTNGNANGYAEHNGKRKNDDQPEENRTNGKKKRIDSTEVVNTTEEAEAEKFKWSEVIRDVIINKNNEIKLSKLRKKVLNRYKKFTGCEINEKIENKFNKKLKRSTGVVVDSEKVKLIQ